MKNRNIAVLVAAALAVSPITPALAQGGAGSSGGGSGGASASGGASGGGSTTGTAGSNARKRNRRARRRPFKIRRTLPRQEATPPLRKMMRAP